MRTVLAACEPTAAERALDTLVIDSPDQLLITQTPFAITVEHPSKHGTHPEAGEFHYGSGGRDGGLPGRGNMSLFFLSFGSRSLQTVLVDWGLRHDRIRRLVPLSHRRAQITGALLLLIPRTALIGAAMLACTMVGAMLAGVLRSARPLLP